MLQSGTFAVASNLEVPNEFLLSSRFRREHPKGLGAHHPKELAGGKTSSNRAF